MLSYLSGFINEAFPPCLTDHDDKLEALTWFPNSSGKKEKWEQSDFSQRPDALFDLGWFGSSTEYGISQSDLRDALSAFLGEDYKGNFGEDSKGKQ